MKIIGKCYELSIKGIITEIDKITFLKKIKTKNIFKLQQRTWKELVSSFAMQEINKNIFNYDQYYILLNKTKEDLETALKLNATKEFNNKNIKIFLKDFDSEERKVLNYILKLQINIVKRVKNKEIALVYDKKGYVNQDNQWIFSVEGKSDSLVLDLATDTDIFHLLQPYSDAVLIVSHNHPNNKTFSLTDIETFLSEPNIKTIIAVTNSIIYVLNKYNFNKTRYLSIKNKLQIKYKNKYTEPYLTELRNDWLNRMESMGIEQREVKYEK